MDQDRGSLQLEDIRPIGEKELQKAIQVLRGIGKLDDYFPIGKPRPELIHAAVTVKRGEFSRLVKEVVGMDGVSIRRLDSFPLGTPWPEEFYVKLEFGGR